MGLPKVLRRRLSATGIVLLDTYGSADRTLEASAAIHVCEAGEVYARDDYVYWGFTAEGLRRLARHTGYEGFELFDAPVIDGHPRIIGALHAGARARLAGLDGSADASKPDRTRALTSMSRCLIASSREGW